MKQPSTTLLNLFERIETIQFSVEMGVHSGVRSFIRALEQHPDFLALQQCVRQEPDRVVKRLAYLATLSYDHAYENPYDTAMATYYWALALLDWTPFKLKPNRYERKAIKFINTIESLHWAEKVLGMGSRQQPTINRVSQRRLGWKYWPTVYAYGLWYRLRKWWILLW